MGPSSNQLYQQVSILGHSRPNLIRLSNHNPQPMLRCNKTTLQALLSNSTLVLEDMVELAVVLEGYLNHHHTITSPTKLTTVGTLGAATE